MNGKTLVNKKTSPVHFSLSLISVAFLLAQTNVLPSLFPTVHFPLFILPHLFILADCCTDLQLHSQKSSQTGFSGSSLCAPDNLRLSHPSCSCCLPCLPCHCAHSRAGLILLHLPSSIAAKFVAFHRFFLIIFIPSFVCDALE